MHFYKTEGAGNDFLFLTQKPDEDPSFLARELCDRRRWIGADGLVTLLGEGERYRIRVYNANGSPAAICGNALRCAGLLLFDLYGKETADLLTPCGVRRVRAEKLPEKKGKTAIFSASMGVPARKTEWESVLSPLCRGDLYAVSVGNPHAVIFCREEELADPDLAAEAEKIQTAHEDGINVEYCALTADFDLCARVFERGVGETAACGSGAVACAFAARLYGVPESGDARRVRMRGGVLSVSFAEDGAAFLSGECRLVGEGDLWR